MNSQNGMVLIVMMLLWIALGIFVQAALESSLLETKMSTQFIHFLQKELTQLAPRRGNEK